ncbi:MAG TPA: hypothetical protein VF725_05445 [Ktedonobacterales bacterium]
MLALLAKYKIAVIVSALLVALGGGGAGVAFAAANGALPNPLNGASGLNVALANAAGAKHGHNRRNPHNGLTHGTIITSVNGAYVTYTIDAGKVSNVSSSSITLTRLDGQQVTLSITANTVWGNHRAAPQHPAKLDGHRIVVFSQNGVAAQIGAGNGLLKNAIHLDATFIRNGKSRTVQIDRGTVQSVSATQISVKRADGQVVTEPVSPKARWVQAPHHTKISPSQVTVGARVAIVTYDGSVIVVRLPAAPTATAGAAS